MKNNNVQIGVGVQNIYPSTAVLADKRLHFHSQQIYFIGCIVLFFFFISISDKFIRKSFILNIDGTAEFGWDPQDPMEQRWWSWNLLGSQAVAESAITCI